MNRPQQHQLTMAENEAAALAAEMFDHFSSATTMRQILGLYRNMCDTIGLRPGPLNEFYPKLKSKIKSWKAQALWKKFDARALHRVYNKGTSCNGTRVLVIGAGPCGLRTAIEAQLLGAKVVLVEKRDRISRNNVLHLWPFLITDLRNLGAKKFYGKFCAGSIDHISIRQLQCILLKVALLLGVEVHEGVSFENTIEPTDGCGWRAQVSPEDHAVSHYEFDVLIGADGKRNTLEGFKRKEFRGKLAIAITANFINKKTEAEAKAEEISGVAFIFNQSFFKELYQTTGIDLENIVYYKDETHYFVMTAKKHSLIDKGVIVQDFSDPAELLSAANVNTEKLLDYAKEAAEFSTKYQMPNLEFAVNHYGKPDVAMFDFTSMFASEISCRVTVRKNYRLLQCLVGDSLLEPFWPTGSGCARGFLSSMDAAYAIKLWNNQRNSILAVLAQRESIYRLLAQTTPENLHRDIGSYTLDPATRYPNLNRSAVTVHQVKHLLDTDDTALLEQTFMDTNALQLVPDQPVRRKRRTADTVPLSTVLLRWIRAQLNSHDFIQNLTDVSECFTNGQVLCALINRYRPDLVDLASLRNCSVKECNELAFKIIEVELRISPVMTAEDSLTLENVDPKLWLTYLEQICEVFRGEIPHVKHPKLDFAELKEKQQGNKVPDFSRLLKFTSRKLKSPSEDVDMAGTINARSLNDDDRGRRSRKLIAENSAGKIFRKSIIFFHHFHPEERMKRLQEIEANRNDRQNKRRLQRAQQTQNFYKSLHMLQANTLLRESDSSSPFEDYSIFLYRQSAPEFTDRVKELERKLLYPDRERGIPSASLRNNGTDDQFNDRIKSMEKQIAVKSVAATDKKPKDLLRAIGKIESNDWNIREIEKKIEQSKKTEVGKSREKVPKWSKEQFLQRQNKMSRPLDPDVVDDKFKEIDQTIKNLDKQLKEGTVLERGQRGNNKVASIAGSFKKKENNQVEERSIQKSNSKSALVFNTPTVSEICHFCKQKVYLMEKITAEGLILHRACLKCHHCHTSLRLGGYAFDRDNPQGLFYCTQHYRLPAKVMRPTPKKSLSRQKMRSEIDANAKTETIPERIRLEGIANLDLLSRGQTPERIEFENATAMSDGEPSLENIIDENEWTDRNFGSGTEESSEIYSSDDSESDSDLDNYEEAMESPLGAQTLQLATDWIGKQRYSSNQYSDDDESDDDEFYDSSEDDEADSQTEGEELEKAREIRMQEVKLKPLPYLATDTETEVVSVDPSLHQPVTKSEIKFIDNNLDHQLSADINKLNESLYKINNFMKLTKEIDDLKKENLVKNDIKRKLSLKEQWLKNSQDSGINNFGSTKSVNYPHDASHRLSNQYTAKAMSASNVDLVKSSPLFERRKLFVAPTGSIQNLNLMRRHLSVDDSPKEDPIGELAFLNNLDITDKEIEILSQEPEFKYVSPQDRLKSNNDKLAKSLKKIELKNFSDTRNHIKSQINIPKVSTTQRDLSKFFPKKEEKVTSSNVNKNQKELKDVNLAKYFAPSPVQELKSLPSPCLTPKSNQSPSLSPRAGLSPNLTPKTGLSPVMPRRNSNSDCNKSNDLKQSLLRDSVENKLKAKSFDMYNQQIDGAVDFKKPSKRELEKVRSLEAIETKSKKKRDVALPEEVDLSNFEKLIDDRVLIERSPSKEYNKLFENETLDEELSDMFEEFAAKIVPKPTEAKVDKKVTKKKSPPKIEIVDSNLTYNKPAPKWCKKEVVDYNNVQAMCMEKFSDKLMNEIKQLEEQIGEKVTNKSSSNEKTTDVKVKKTLPKKVIKKVPKSVDGETKLVTKKVVKKVDKIPDAVIMVNPSPKEIVKPKRAAKERSTEDILFDEVCASNSVLDDINMLERTIYNVPSVERLKNNSKDVLNNGIPNISNGSSDLSSISTMKPLTSSVNQLPTSPKIAPAKPVRRNKSMSSSNSPDVPPRKNTLLGSVTKLYQTIKNAASSPPTKDEKQSNGQPSENGFDVPDGNIGKIDEKNKLSGPLDGVAPKQNIKLLFRYKPITVVRCSTPPSLKKPIIEPHKSPENAILSSSNGIEINRHRLLERQHAVDHLNHIDSEPNTRRSLNEQKVKSLESIDQPKRFSSNYEDAISCHYDNVGSRHQSPIRPEKPPRKISATDRETDRLIERSQLIHNRKEEFMNAKLSCSNPYMKKVIDDERNEVGYGCSRSRDELRTDICYSKGRDDSKYETKKDIFYGRTREVPIEKSYVDSHGHAYGSGTNGYVYSTGSNSHYSTPYGSSTLTRQLSKQNSIPSAISSNSGNSKIFTSAPPSSSTASKYGLGLFTKKCSTQSSANFNSKFLIVLTEQNLVDKSSISQLKIKLKVSINSLLSHRQSSSEISSSNFERLNDSMIRRIQSDSESSSPIVELNSATEISTDSEFEQDPVKFPPPNIVIDDTHLRKPTKVQNEFKPLVQVDPSVLSSTRMPLRNPRPGDYLLNKTASTEGIASKKSLELKKRYLLGEPIPGGIMKSDSTSVLDSKFKNFRSNITECQKLLNPTTDFSSVMDSFLKNTIATQPPLVGSKELDEKNSDEKENVYGKFVIDKNEMNKTENVTGSDALKISDLTETINTTLVDNKIREMSPKIEIIDLVTPEKAEPIIDLSRIEISEKMVKRNQKFINELDVNDESIEVIDLTGDSPAKETKNLPQVPIPLMEVKAETTAEKNKSAIDSMLTQCDAQKTRTVDEDARSRSPAQETSIRVPNIPWSAKKKNSDLESDSLSSSTTSSVDDIPHFILDSTTSPDTQPGDLPRLEIRDTTGELMQIDSLMIIDGKYVGDPEDLKHMKMPDGSRVTEQLVGEPKCDKIVAEKKVLRYESFSQRKPDLKFDTKNENKIDTLKNIPLVISAGEATTGEKIVKPSVLHLSDENTYNKDLEDMDKTPTAATYAESAKSDSETEMTGQVLTETELSDWTADDAVSENFVDIEFVLNSNKGTIKRKKSKKKLSSHKANVNVIEKPTICPIVNKDLDFEGFEFMDTGSEDSCLETYSATNKAMLKNRGYVQFVENNSVKGASSYKSDAGYGSSPKDSFESKTFKPPDSLEIHEAVNKEVAGIDYIEQGACLLVNDTDIKTPMNEVPPIFSVKKSFDVPVDSLNDIDDDSLLMIASQGTTTEDSDALTVVTSPVDSTPKNVETPSSDRKDLFAEEINSYDPTSKESKTPTRKQSVEDSPLGTNRRKDSDECTYEEYVRKLQMKISQISNARDSIDIRKTRRKSSKGDNSGTEQTQQSNSVIDSNKSLSVYVNKSAVDETSPITVMERLEEITKERAKQKDLIHELVMDKLQSKKQLNAEKRLNRSRNRSSMFSPGISPQTPPSIGTVCSNGPHIHIGQTERSEKQANSSDRWNITKTPYSMAKSDVTSTSRKDRPFSDIVEATPKELPQILKTQSFCVYSTPSIYSLKADSTAKFVDNGHEFNTPVPPPRRKIDDTITQTEKLRQDARARARLKSNQDLGLSPDEKIQLLRKRFNLDHLADEISKNKCDDIKIRERKMMTSKSVNDISATTSQEHVNDHNFGSTKKQYKQNDFTSDPNLAEEDSGQKRRHRNKDPERRKSIIRAVSDFFHKKRDSKETSPTNGKDKPEGMFGRFRLSPKSKAKEKDEPTIQHERSKSEDYLKIDLNTKQYEEEAPPIPPLPINYQRSDDESCSANESRKLKAHSKASRQAELKRLRIAQEIQREQEEIEVKLKDLEARGVLLEKALRGEEQNPEVVDQNGVSVGANDEKLLKELLEIWRNITQLKKRDDELGIRQQELKLEHRHAQLKEQLNTRLSCSKLDKSSSDVAAEGAILNEMLEIVAKRAALRPSDTLPHGISSSQAVDGLESDI
ncbi:[F-actin]-monooxygenase Mical [Pseudolycoriella hygida]|uniref:F-actin monooxygenase n=1 Tax=Pseudolycoriella hygida TaxID=35572 RepID=A0A9Q0S046_9DIPT|nr:[F-actin]-monooxygenase Mical [Pseudolycoriella hygida]